MSYAFTQVELGRIEQMHALRRLFGQSSQFSNETVAAISQLTRAQRVARGTQLANEGEPFRSVFLIIEGRLELTRDGMRLGEFTAGDGVGAISGLSRDPRGFGCRALDDSTLLVLHVEDLLEVMEDHFDMMHGALRALAGDAITWRKTLPNAGFSDRVREEPVFRGDHALGLVERILYLRKTIGLHDSNIGELALLARAAREVRQPAGTPLWYSGERAENMLILVRGEVSAKSPEGASFRFGPGDILGNLDTIAGLPRWFDARAERDLVALTLDSEAIVDVWEDHPALGFAFLRMLSHLIVSLRVQAAPLQLPAATQP